MGGMEIFGIAGLMLTTLSKSSLEIPKHVSVSSEIRFHEILNDQEKIRIWELYLLYNLWQVVEYE